MTPLIAPQLVWPMISTTFEPATLQANSMLPKTSSISNIPRNATAKDIANTEVKNQFGGCS
jgi:hypothetical protein